MQKRRLRARSAAGLMLSAALALPAQVALAPGRACAAETDASARAAARRLVLEGDAAYGQKDNAKALERYQAAYQLMHVPTVGIEVIKAQKALGELVEAHATALEVAGLPKQEREPAVFDQARLQAAQDGLRLSGMIPTLWLDVGPRGLVYKVEIDGTTPTGETPFHLNPGPHDVRLSAPGYQTLELKVNLLEAERQTLTALLYEDPSAAPRVAPAPATAAPPPVSTAAAPEPAPVAERPAPTLSAGADHTLGWLGVGVAGVAAAVGTFAGISAIKQKPDCPNDVCAPSQRDAIDNSKQMGTVANISFGVAIVTGVLGIWQLASGGDDPESAQAEPEAGPRARVGLGPGSLELQVSGSF